MKLPVAPSKSSKTVCQLAAFSLLKAEMAASLSAVVALVSSLLENTNSSRAPLLLTTVAHGRN